MIDARQLHTWLGAKWGFAHWIENRIAEYGFEEGTDFWRSFAKTGGRPRKEVLVTVDMAKELSMVERTERASRPAGTSSRWRRSPTRWPSRCAR